MKSENPEKIVAIETSSRTGSVAVGRGAKLLAARGLSAGMRHAVELMPTVSALVAEQGWRPEEIDQIYLSLGPGSFTGLRIAVAGARAMAQAIRCRLVGVPSLDVIARNAGAEFRVIVPVLDAKRGQVFAARYERSGGGEIRQTVAPVLVDPRAFIAESIEAARGERVAILGEGVEYHRAELLAGGDVVELNRSLWIPRAEVVFALGCEMAGRREFSNPETLLPIYIRLAEAEEVWRKKHGVPL